MMGRLSTVHTAMGLCLNSAFSEDDPAAIRLDRLMKDCDNLMEEIRKTAKEVGGDPEKSMRYLEAQQIKSTLNTLRSLGMGTYTYVTARTATD